MEKISKIFLALAIIGLLVIVSPSMGSKENQGKFEEKSQGKFIESPPAGSMIDPPGDNLISEAVSSDSTASTTAIVPSFSPSDFLGTWNNNNIYTKGMKKFIITRGTFHGYGSCTPTLCDWGTTPLILYSTSVTSTSDIAGTAQYNFGFSKTITTLRMINTYSIRASHYTQFTDGSGRHNYVEENMVFSYQRLPAPVLVSPRNGTIFSHYPRTTKLDWNPVAGAVKYKVEIQYCSPSGCGVWAVSYPIVIRLTSDYTFNFVGAQPGRWRVWAIDANGKEGLKSAWWNFRYTI